METCFLCLFMPGNCCIWLLCLLAAYAGFCLRCIFSRSACTDHAFMSPQLTEQISKSLIHLFIFVFISHHYQITTCASVCTKSIHVISFFHIEWITRVWTLKKKDFMIERQNIAWLARSCAYKFYMGLSYLTCVVILAEHCVHSSIWCEDKKTYHVCIAACLGQDTYKINCGL